MLSRFIENNRRFEVFRLITIKLTVFSTQHLHPFSNKLQQSIQTNQDLEAVECYNQLQEYSGSFQTSQCVNLKTYINETVLFWSELVNEKLKK